MFGIYRFLLASLVVVAHIGHPPHGWSGMAGHAVFAFFVLSGYLMTKVTNRSYGFSREGIGRFLLNRALRIYPLYWVVLLATFAFIAICGNATEYHSKMMIPRSLAGWISNLTMFGLANGGFTPLLDAIIVPPSWALEIELFFYICIGLGLGQRKLWWPWVACTIAAFVGIRIFQATGLLAGGFSYGSIPYGSVAFLIGAGVYHFREAGQKFLAWSPAGNLISIAVIAVFAFLVASPYATALPSAIRLFATAILHGILVFLLAELRAPRDSIPSSVDRWLGGVSYPLYLIHYPIGLFLLATFGLPARGGLAFAVVLPIAILVSLLLHWQIEKRLESIRDSVRGNSKPGQMATDAKKPEIVSQ